MLAAWRLLQLRYCLRDLRPHVCFSGHLFGVLAQPGTTCIALAVLAAAVSFGITDRAFCFAILATTLLAADCPLALG